MDAVADISGLLSLWKKAAGGDPAVRIAIIDGPVDFNHPSLNGANVALRRQVAGFAAPTIRSEHGTHVSSLLMGVPGSPVLGIAPNCTGLVYSIYNENAEGEIEPSSQATLALAINQAVADGADVINISSGQETSTGQADRILADAVRRCADAGKLIVAAAGNGGCRCVQVPGALESVLAVGACDLAGNPMPFSNFGDPYLDNGILAPGENVKGASPSQQVALRSGTSFATPIVSGVVALLLSCLRQSGREVDPRAVFEALLTTAAPCNSAGADELRCLAGHLDIPAAAAALFGEAADEGDGLSPSHAGADRADATLFVTQPHIVTQSPVAREDSMADLVATSALSSPRLLGPDGMAIRNAGVMPSEAQPAAAPADSGMAAAAASPAPFAAPAAAAASAPATPPAGPGVMWVPMQMPHAGGFPTAWAAEPSSGVTPSAPPPQPASVAAPAVARSRSAPAVRPSECGCGVRPAQVAEPAGQLAFPIGQLYYDFGKEARLDYFVQAISNWRDGLGERGDPAFGKDRDRSADVAAPYNPAIMARYLLDQPQPREGATFGPATGISYRNLPDADAIIWTLTIDAIPVYAIKPLDIFGLTFYSSLVTALWYQDVSKEGPEASPDRPRTTTAKAAAAPSQDDSQPPGNITRVSLAGWVESSDTTRLLNGTVVPTLVSDWRGFYVWELDTLFGKDAWPEGAKEFLERIYNEFRNVGISPQDRALNYSAMNAYNTKRMFADVVKAGLKKRLDTVEVDRSTICRPESDCWDVTYRFFDPTNVLTQARDVYQYTIDVSDVVPVAVGPLRQWQIY
jgi:cyanobactin maturation PatA/PatG family protease